MPQQSEHLPGLRPDSLAKNHFAEGHSAEAFYSADSLLRHPLKLIGAMRRDLLAARELAWRLLVRDIRAQYRQSLLGIFWAFVPPIATAAGLTLANNAQVLNVGATDLPYPAYVMLSMALWQTFAESVTGQVQAILNAKYLLSRINFPREALVLSQLGQVGFNFLIKLVLIVALFLWFKMPVTWAVIVAPVALLHLVGFGTGIGLLLAPFGGLYEDISRGLTLLLTGWLFITPVLYPLPQSGLFAMLVKLNPVTPLLMTTRELATIGTVSNPGAFWLASLTALLVLLLGWLVYRVAMPFMIERISA
ncbi:ABC transporter permease [Leptolyngbya sp. FACHB-711]|uniref:ABC transporter permease n=1 Tax=unclassified Leptolyngbya TaxID=2650499 RepID=UPI001688B8A8|nr:ABC transporter permease [Leptolyngbya sp. FACHB-711]MBD1852131.1 ABC transporter permease [Cyanobacteria bacterium FACHB-502]MBD2025576.1 ABC transporter permease [Leptolyngbya sp. FACHB-711]